MFSRAVLTAAPVEVALRYRDIGESRRILDAEVVMASRARAARRPDRWMTSLAVSEPLNSSAPRYLPRR